MAQVILTKNMFVGHRIRKSPNKFTPVYVPDEFLKFVPPGSKVIETGGEAPRKKEVVEGFTLKDFDDLRQMHEVVEKRIGQVSVSVITSDAQELIAKHDLDPNSITGTGKNGRITKADVLNFLDGMN